MVKQKATTKRGGSKSAPKKTGAKQPAPEAKASSKKATPKKKPLAAKAMPKKHAPVKTSKAKAIPAKKKKTKAEAKSQKSVKTAQASKAAKPQQKVKKPATKNNTAAKPTAAPKSKVGVLSRQFMLELAAAIRSAVEPHARSVKARQVVDTAPSGDATFELDRIAEKALLGFLKQSRAPIAYYSEDAGYSTFSSAAPKHLLVVDPIDGTRAAKNGFEGCAVSIASTRVIERPTMADVDSGCVAELLGARVFYAERGKGIRITDAGRTRKPRLSENTNLETLSWALTVPARPAELTFPTAARLIDLSSLKGGFFACNSTSYSLTRLLTGQLDACVDFAGRYLKDIPEYVEDYFINAGRGTAVGICPYDFAAALLIAQESGCVVTNAYGEGFGGVMLLDSSTSNQQSLIAAANLEMHRKLLSYFDTRIKQFEALLARRAKARPNSAGNGK